MLAFVSQVHARLRETIRKHCISAADHRWTHLAADNRTPSHRHSDCHRRFYLFYRPDTSETRKKTDARLPIANQKESFRLCSYLFRGLSAVCRACGRQRVRTRDIPTHTPLAMTSVTASSRIVILSVLICFLSQIRLQSNARRRTQIWRPP